MTREDIYGALFALVTPLLAPGAIDGPPDGKPDSAGISATPGAPTPGQPFNLISRDMVEVQRVPPLLQPVLFMDEALEESVRDGNGLYHHRWTLYFHLGCTAPRGTPAQTVLNPLLDALEAVLAPGDGNLLGLGDAIESAQIAGIAVKNLGNNSTDPNARQAVAYVPFEIVFG